MPRTSLDATTSQSFDRVDNHSTGSWCRRLLRGVRRSALCVAAGLAGLSTTAADAQIQAAPVYQSPGSPDAGAAAVYNQPFTQQQLPWPSISPYYPANVLSTTHINQNGLWMKDIAQKGRDYHFSVHAIWTRIDGAGEKPIGQNPLDGALSQTGQLTSAQAPPSGQAIFGIGANGFIAGTALDSLFNQLPLGFVLAGPGVFPYPLLSFDEVNATEADLDLVASNAAYPVRSLSDISGPSLVGSRLRWGFDNEDGSGFEITGFHTGEDEGVFSRGSNVVGTLPANFTTVAIANPFTYFNVQLGAIPLDNGRPTFPVLGGNLGITGSTQKYDVFYEVANTTKIYGVAGSVFGTSLFNGESSRIRLFVGGEYTGIDETFRFRGIDSGATLNLEDYQSVAGFLPGGAVGGGGAGGAGGTLGGIPSNFQGNIVTPVLTPLSPDKFIDAWLYSNTKSHLAGPTVGLRYEIGRGTTFSLWGETIFGLLANVETTTISSQNIAEQQHSKTVYGTALDAFSEPDGTPRPDDFARATYERSDTHVSPIFKQGVHAEVTVGGLIPPLGKTSLFENAKITAGYQVTIIGQVQRPGEAIYWRGFTGDRANSFPFPISDRSTLLFQEANLGLEWLY